ncbi:MAG: N-acetylmuramoyl-L-alanine amidase [Dehalococcoidales bacterium]
MSELTKVYDDTDDDFVVVDARDYLKPPPGRFYNRIPGRKISQVIYHHTAGNWRSPPSGMEASHRYIVNVKGWPKLPYHVYVPAKPIIWGSAEGGGEWHDNRFTIYLVNDFDDLTWHVGRGGNRHGIGVVFQGFFLTHDTAPSVERGLAVRHPFPAQQYLAPRVWRWLRRAVTQRQGTPPVLKGHNDYGKARCPGWWLSQFIAAEGRGEVWPPVEG